QTAIELFVASVREWEERLQTPPRGSSSCVPPRIGKRRRIILHEVAALFRCQGEFSLLRLGVGTICALSVAGLGVNSLDGSNGSHALAGDHGKDDVISIFVFFPFYS